MSLENNISKVIQEQLQGDLIERVIAEQLENCVSKAVDKLFGSWGDCTKIVEEKIKEVMLPQLSNYDYSKHIIKLDHVLTDILKSTTIDNKKILENFKEYMSVDTAPKTIKISELFSEYKKYVAKEIDTDGLEVNYDDGAPRYNPVDVKMEVEQEEGRSWSSFKYAKVFFECEKDGEEVESMNFEISISRYERDKKDEWDFSFNKFMDVNALRYIEKFAIYLMNLRQNGTTIIIDEEYGNSEVIPDKEPELTYE